MSPVLGTDRVYAQTETPTPPPTPTATFSPLTNPDTTTNNYDTTCPGVQPSGWGVVTPAPFWMLECGHCVTPVPNYDWGDDFDWGDSPWELATPTPASQPLTCPQATIKLGATELLVGQTMNYGTAIAWNEPYMGYSWSAKVFDWSRDPGSIYRGGVSMRIAHENDLKNFTDAKVIIKVSGQDALFDEREIILDGLKKYSTIVCDSWVGGGDQVDCSVEVYSWGCSNSSATYPLKLEIWGNKFYAGEAGAPGNNFYDVAISSEYENYGLYPPDIGTEPTPEPVTSYCSQVNSDGQNYDPLNPGDDPNFNMGGFYVGTASCFTIGGFEIPIEWMNNFIGSTFTNPILPGTQWCFTPIEFGSLTLFGVDMDLDFIALGMAGILLFRFITRS